MFCVLEKKFGREKLLKALSSLYMRFKGTREANTETFLKLVSEQVGADAGEVAKNFLASPWTSVQMKEVKSNLLR